ncbi:phosphate ABC transporter permease subunit PstC [Sphingobacterium sp. MYb382]|uniref:phosphate ABC transporter permease subunit PstC n=1 Tax=Sphingobacterium sp. MYb382 TaxID=2745278 RepID=UPI0030A35EC7
MNGRLRKDKFIKIYFASILVLVLAVVFVIAIGLVVKSMPLLESESLGKVLFGKTWSPMNGDFGFFPFIMGTVWVTVISLVIAVPLCVLAAMYLIAYASTRLRNIVLPLINVLAAIPPVLYGVWGVLFVVPAIREYVAPIFGVETTGYSVLAGGMVLAVMIFPIMLSIMVAVLSGIPKDLKDASLALGATRWETLTKVELLKARPGLLAAAVLGISRAFGETIAVLMVCGNVPKVPKFLFDAGYPLPALIANNFGEMMSIPNYDAALMFAALLLFVIILGFNMGSRLVLNRMEGEAA